MSQFKSKQETTENTRYTKIKDVHLELPDFSFFHSASGRFRDNPKMVGRERIKKKLYGILTNAETKTGSYIITGFRGVGKTSLLNQVVNELKPRTTIFLQSFRIMVTWVILHLLVHDLCYWSDEIKPYFPGFAMIFLIVLYLIFKANSFTSVVNRSYWEYQFRTRFRLVIKRLVVYFREFGIVDRGIYKRSFAKNILYVIQYAVFLDVCYFLWFLEQLPPIDLLICLTVWVAIAVVSVVNRFLLVLWRWRIAKSRNQKKRSLRKSYLALKFIKQKINHSQKVFVRISFPQETLQSKDVLKSMVHHLTKEYERYNGFMMMTGKVISTLTILFLATLFYNSKFNQRSLLPAIREVSPIGNWFPSQSNEINQLDPFYFKILDEEQNLTVSYASLLRQAGYVYPSSNEEKPFLEFTHLVDATVLVYYFKISSFFDPFNRLKINRRTAVPELPDIYCVMLLLFVFSISHYIARNGRKLGIITNHSVRKLLNDLKDKCDAEVEQSVSSNYDIPVPQARAKSFFSFKRSRKLQFPLAGAREIENDLIHIFDELDRIPKIFAPPEFVFVFDELDKVEPRTDLHSDNNNEVLEGSLESEKTRKKREVVSSIMASMKIFFTTAKAKFIFIAGREMYDASLADSSDRESSLGSIFHDIIYVSTLYKDPFDDHTNRTIESVDITHLTERYVCMHLIPPDQPYAHTIQGYSEYLDDHLELFGSIRWSPSRLRELKQHLNRGVEVSDLRRDPDFEAYYLQKLKAINILTAFIYYLAFRCKGSPMIMLKLFEDFVEEFPHKNYRVFNDPDKFILGENPQTFYLTFDFHAQYRISFVAGLFRPFALETGPYLKSYSDKILVSTSYLLDHIYKFHEFGFSWRNLELLPEIIDINRAPLLRKYIEKVISFISDSNLKEVNNGFVAFKFHRKTIEEINHLSRMSDTESAIFHFTLDESFATKRHYLNRLKRLRRELSEKNEYLEGQHFVNSTSFLKAILGDLYFFDKEYDEAIIQYTNAIQSLKAVDSSKWDMHQTYLFFRILMKEALVFERINTPESSLAKYGRLVEVMRQHGSLLDKVTRKELLIRENPDFDEGLLNNNTSEESKSDHHFTKVMYENFPSAFLPILSRLVAIDKVGKPGITLKDSRRADKDFHNIFDQLKKDEKFLIKAEYHLNKGNILYYKNGILFGDEDNSTLKDVRNIYGGLQLHEDYNAPLSAYKEYCLGLAIFISKIDPEKAGKILKIKDQSLDNPIVGKKVGEVTDVEKYEDFVALVEDLTLSDKHGNPRSSNKLELIIIRSVRDILRDYEIRGIINFGNKEWSVLAKLMSALGDCLLIMCGNPEKASFDFENIVEEDEAIRNEANRTKRAIYLYSLAADCYRRASEIRNSAFQHKKIIYVNKLFCKYLGKGSTDMDSIKSYLFTKIIEPNNQNRHLIIYPEQSKIKLLHPKWIPASEKNSIFSNEKDYYRFSYNTEVKLSMLHYFEIESFKKGVIDVPIDEYSPVNDQMVRILELRFNSRNNRARILKDLDFHDSEEDFRDYLENISNRKGNDTSSGTIDEILDQDQEFSLLMRSPKFDNTSHSKEAMALIIDGIFCDLRIIEGLKFDDISYIKTYYYLASAYLSLGWWAKIWDKYLASFGEGPKAESRRKMSKDALREVVGVHQTHYVDNPEYAFERAHLHFHKCISAHSSGKEYHAILSNMYFSEGDFNDDNQHFCAAVDRWLINNKIVRIRLQYLKWQLQESIFRK